MRGGEVNVRRWRLKIAVFFGEKLEDLVLVGDEGCLWFVEKWRFDLSRIEGRL